MKAKLRGESKLLRTVICLTLAPVVVALALTSCSVFEKDDDKKSGGGGANISGTLSVTTEDEVSLPPCDASRQGVLAYVIGSKSFFTCTENAWLKVEIEGTQGAPGPQGDPGVEQVLPSDQAFQLYEQYRRGVFRLNVACTKIDPECTDEKIYNGGFGTGFACAPGKICTNKHVLLCKPPSEFTCEYQLSSVAVFQLPGTGDGLVGADGKELPAVQTLEGPAVNYSGSRDLAVITAAAFAEGTPILPLPEQDFKANLRVLDPILSLSFPLGFSDLYTDLGAVNTPDLRQCPEKKSKYGCIGSFYDFATTNDTDKGSSGSPLFNVRTGQVIGITSGGTVSENANYTWAIDAFLLQSLQ